MRNIYQYGQTAPDLPVQVCDSGENPRNFQFQLLAVSDHVKFWVSCKFINNYFIFMYFYVHKCRLL